MGHPSHYNSFKKIEMEIFKDGKKLDIIFMNLVTRKIL